MTTSSWLLEFQGLLNRWVVYIPKTQLSIINPLIYNSIQLQRASTDTCQQTNLAISVYVHPSAGYYPVQIIAKQQMNAYELVYIGQGTLPNYFQKINVIMTLSGGGGQGHDANFSMNVEPSFLVIDLELVSTRSYT